MFFSLVSIIIQFLSYFHVLLVIFIKIMVKKKRKWSFFSTGHPPWYIIVAISLCWLVLVIGFNNNSIWSIFESSSSCKTNFYCEPLKHVLFRKRDMQSTLTQSVILRLNLCNKTTVKWYNKRIYVSINTVSFSIYFPFYVIFIKKNGKKRDCNFQHGAPITEGCWRTSASSCCKSWRGSCGHRS